MNELRCIIGGEEINYPYSIEEFLLLEGHLVTSKQKHARSLLQVCINTRPDIIIINNTLEGMNLLELCKNISEQKIAPILLVGKELDISGLSNILKTDVFGFLVVPFSRDNLISVVETAVSKFQYISNLEKELKDYKNQLENRVQIEKAKGLLMKFKDLSEKDAYSMMRKISMDKCMSMQRVAKAIIKNWGEGNG